MCNIVTVYTKNYSDISNLQKSKQVSYCILEDTIDNQTRYGIAMLMEAVDLCESGTMPSLSTSRQAMLDIVAFLYENSVLIETWQDVVGDLMFQQTFGDGALKDLPEDFKETLEELIKETLEEETKEELEKVHTSEAHEDKPYISVA